MKALQLTREYPPHIYGGAGVVVDQLTQALRRRMKVEVRCFGQREPTDDGVVVRGYTAWEQLRADKNGEPRFAPALETLSIDLAMARLGVRTPYVLFVGRITDQKGIFHLIEAARRLPAGVQVVVCASAPDTPEIEERLRRAVATMPNVLWINEMVKHDVVVQLYSHAAVFCCPSVYEPFGIINLEAMACETSVVASAVGGILEVVVDGETGLLVPPARPDALAAALTRLLNDPDTRRRMGQAGRRRVEAHFSWASVAERTERVYSDAIADFKRSSAGD